MSDTPPPIKRSNLPSWLSRKSVQHPVRVTPIGNSRDDLVSHISASHSMDGIGNRRTFSLKRYGPATSIKSDTSYDVAVERVLSLASTTPSGGSELIRNPTRERLAQMANRRASFAFPPKDLISGNIRDGLSGRLHTMKGPVIEQMAVHYLFFLIILVVAHFTSWAPEIRFYTSFGYFILAACAFQISRLIYTKSPKSILPFYISIIVSSYLNVISREAHMLVSVLWYASFTIILLQSGNDRLHRHLILFSVAYAAFYFISLTIMVNIYALKCVSMVCGAGLKKPINWAHEGILIAGCTTILASFLMLERFIKESAKILIERDNNYKNLYMINMDLKRKLRLAKKGKDNKTVDLDSPLQKALDILKEQQVKLEVEKPDGWNVEVEKLEVALTILSSGQLYDPSLPQRDTDADIHDWLLNNGILKSQQHAPGSHSKAAATFSNKSHASFPTRSSLAIYNPTPRRRQSNYSVPAIRTSSEGSHSTGVNIKISNHSLNNFPYSGPISIEFEALHMLQNVDCADFDILALDRVTHGRSLFFTMSYLFKEYDFFEKFRVNEAKFARFVTKLEAGYKSNPYHNAIHAADVTQVMHVFINTHRMHSFLSLEDKFACIIAAAIHDYAHPGVNNFLVSTVNPLALRYNDQAVLENFHCSSAFELMQSEDCDILASLEPEKRKHVRELIVSMVLATDMAQHFDWLNKFKNKVQTGTFNYENKADKKLVMNIAIKCADINNPTKPASQCQKWTDMIMDEFYKQGDEEKKRNLPVSMFMNRDTPDTAKCQIAFIDFLVYPVYDVWNTYLENEIQDLMQNIQSNKAYWRGVQAAADSRLVASIAGLPLLPRDAFIDANSRSMSVVASQEISVSSTASERKGMGPVGASALGSSAVFASAPRVPSGYVPASEKYVQQTQTQGAPGQQPHNDNSNR